MIYKLIRFFQNENTILGCIDIEGKPYYTCENSWKDNQRSISCIPEGEYKVKRHISPSKGECFSIEEVKNRSYILIHSGNIHTETEGCILAGLSIGKLKGFEAILNSKNAMEELLSFLPEEFDLIIENHFSIDLKKNICYY